MSRYFELLCRGQRDALLEQPTNDLLARLAKDDGCCPLDPTEPLSDSPDHAAPYQQSPRVTVQDDAVKPQGNLPTRTSVEDPLPLDRRRSHRDLSELAQEEVIKLVQRLFLFPNSAAPRVVVFLSIDKVGGSSEICLRVGEALAAQGSGTVCLLDANLRTPSLHQLIGTGRSPGLTDAMIDPEPIIDFAVPMASGRLWLVPPGSPTLQAAGLFGLERFCSRIAELKNEFDYVLIDAPPVGACADAVLLGQKADGVILIVEANSTRRETARVAKETFKSAKVKVLGAILNNRTFPIPEALYRKL